MLAESVFKSCRQEHFGRSSNTYQIFLLPFLDYGVLLTELTLQPDGSPPLRQMAALLLKKYVDTHWYPEAEKFQAPEAAPQAKASIRNMLPHGLNESISKVSHDSTNFKTMFCTRSLPIFCSFLSLSLFYVT